MRHSVCHWNQNAQEFEVHYSEDNGEIADYTLYPKPEFKLSKNDEQEILEAIYDDMQFADE